MAENVDNPSASGQADSDQPKSKSLIDQIRQGPPDKSTPVDEPKVESDASQNGVTDGEKPKTEAEEPKSGTEQQTGGSSFGKKAVEVLGTAALAVITGEEVEALGKGVIKEGGKFLRRKLWGGTGEKVPLSEFIRRRKGAKNESSGRGGSGTREIPATSGSSDTPPNKPPTEPPTEPPSGGGGEPPKNNPPENGGEAGKEEPKGPSFEELQRIIDDPKTPEDQRKLAKAEVKKMTDDVTNFDKDLLGDARAGFILTLKKSEWDDVYENLLEKGKNYDDELMDIAGANSRWRGIYRQAFSAEAAKVVIAGIESKRSNTRGVVSPEWYNKHGYNPKEIVRYRYINERKHIFDLAPDIPEAFVGSSLKTDSDSTNGVPDAGGTAGRPASGSSEARDVQSPEEQRAEFLEDEASGAVILDQIPALTSIIWKGLEKSEKEYWQLRLALSNGRARKQAARGIEDLSPNPELMGLTKEGLQQLTDRKGVSEAIAVYSVMVMNPRFTESIKDSLDMTTTRIIDGLPDGASLGKFRSEFQGYLRTRLGLNESEALDAEQIAYNFINVTGLIEEYDTRSSQNLAEVANGNLRDLMRPRSKLLEAIAKGKVWPPNIFGNWARYNANRLLKHPDQVPLASNLTTGFMTKETRDYVYRKGMNILMGRTDTEKLDWSRSSNNPFRDYYGGKLGPAILVLNTIIGGGLPKEKTIHDLENAFKALGTVGRKTRETILFMLTNEKRNFLKPTSRNFQPSEDPLYMLGYWDQMQEEYPNFFN